VVDKAIAIKKNNGKEMRNKYACFNVKRKTVKNDVHQVMHLATICDAFGPQTRDTMCCLQGCTRSYVMS